MKPFTVSAQAGSGFTQPLQSIRYAGGSVPAGVASMLLAGAAVSLAALVAMVAATDWHP